jgi:flavin prenyltransferase
MTDPIRHRTRPNSVDAIVDHTVGRALDLFGLGVAIPRWS